MCLSSVSSAHDQNTTRQPPSKNKENNSSLNSKTLQHSVCLCLLRGKLTTSLVLGSTPPLLATVFTSSKSALPRSPLLRRSHPHILCSSLALMSKYSAYCVTALKKLLLTHRHNPLHTRHGGASKQRMSSPAKGLNHESSNRVLHLLSLHCPSPQGNSDD